MGHTSSNNFISSNEVTLDSASEKIWNQWKTEAKKSKSLYDLDENGRKKGRSSYYNDNLQTWSIQPTWDYDDEFDYSNVAYWRYRAGHCPHSYHTPGWIPSPWPQKQGSYPNTISGGLGSWVGNLRGSGRIDLPAAVLIGFILFLIVVYGG